MYRVSDIMHENGRFWVLRERRHGRTLYLVCEVRATHSVVRSTIDMRDEGLALAIGDCDRRAESVQ